MMQVIEPKYQLPARSTLTNSELPKLYAETQRAVTDSLKEAIAVSITTDGWTSRATQGYLTVTCHFIDNNWEFVNYVLQTRVLEQQHTGENIGQVIKECTEEWNIREKVQSIVTDNAANMTVAVKKAEIDVHVGCFAHTLNLAAKRGLKIYEEAGVLEKLRQIASYFHRSTTASAVF